MTTDTWKPGNAGTQRIAIIGIGGAGTKALALLAGDNLPGVALAILSTDAGALAECPAVEKFHLDAKLVRGPVRDDAERGRAALEQHLPGLKTLLAGAEVVFILAGLGGATGTSISVLVARMAKEAGGRVLGIVTTPFECEGNRKIELAHRGLEELRAAAHGVLCLPNQEVLKQIEANSTLLDTFKRSNELLADCARGLWRVLTRTGPLEIHLDELCALLSGGRAESLYAATEASGPERLRDLVENLLAHPMLDAGRTLAEVDAVMVGLVGGPDLAMAEVNRIMEQITVHCQGAQVLMGAAIDETFKERLAVTLVARRRPAEQPSDGVTARVSSGELIGARSRGDSAELENQLLTVQTATRLHSRFLPPPPPTTPEKLEQLMAKQRGAAGRQRKTAAKLQQGQLPLEIVSKGRFEKSEPTIHRGEDLDVPTYIRRGVVLN